MAPFKPAWTYLVSKDLVSANDAIVYSQPLSQNSQLNSIKQESTLQPVTSLKPLSDNTLLHTQLINNNTTLQLRLLGTTQPERVVNIEYHVRLLHLIIITTTPNTVCWLLTLDGRLIRQELPPNEIWAGTMTAKSTICPLQAKTEHASIYNTNLQYCHPHNIFKRFTKADKSWCEYKSESKHTFWPLLAFQSFGSWIGWQAAEGTDKASQKHAMILASHRKNAQEEVSIALRKDRRLEVCVSGPSALQKIAQPLPWLQEDGKLEYPEEPDVLESFPGGLPNERRADSLNSLASFAEHPKMVLVPTGGGLTLVVYSDIGVPCFLVYTLPKDSILMELTQTVPHPSKDTLLDMDVRIHETTLDFELVGLWKHAKDDRSAVRTVRWSAADKGLFHPRWRTVMPTCSTNTFDAVRYLKDGTVVLASATSVGSVFPLSYLEASFLYHTKQKEDSLMAECFSPLEDVVADHEIDTPSRQELASLFQQPPTDPEKLQEMLRTTYTSPISDLSSLGLKTPTSPATVVALRSLVHVLVSPNTNLASKSPWFNLWRPDTAKFIIQVRHRLLLSVVSIVTTPQTLAIQQAYDCLEWVTRQAVYPALVDSVDYGVDVVHALLPIYPRLPVSLCLKIESLGDAPTATQLANEFLDPSVAKECLDLTTAEREFLALRHVQKCIPSRLEEAMETLVAMPLTPQRQVWISRWLEAAYAAEEYDLICSSNIEPVNKTGGSGRLTWEELSFAYYALRQQDSKANQSMKEYLNKARPMDDHLKTFFTTPM
ncbi:hypothetical protein PHYBLDRAFT_146519 [Phycomyces blakesleeanus NRRL 1555(-)]|uniref:Uncharacterized protein n=1 Tax=Phycomyces blakesleeanus (strain ATCC 8743b / DSM 1359 / FGSC 10004 / NBRC 33097 / NRRL 1555) TaxID=763407 RepID=A0A162N9D1_PHYB8|nr:hypothetical protein PHYBLDRAFT_146519 [Phycomyces blakesleeanus NRRL 1555(-)]OAD72318.1 hypothetical protein PHYBLDRAFT_146519 [Phycomyces blakesleeanus NRRL 1555(-)]|eukprot:XP_018290358.1 hypothetical protein PHYBLDRAFT_146519 [Phycomyces blakesleeanus NRRL 1555(-)]